VPMIRRSSGRRPSESSA